MLKSFDMGAGSRDERQKAMFSMPPEELFEVKEVPFTLPEGARIFGSIACEACGESTAENHIRLQEGKKLCLDCYNPYSRFM